jgi:cytochrome oxidase Cu insertion factor (SCO1/SenC/PrrC family)
VLLFLVFIACGCSITVKDRSLPQPFEETLEVVVEEIPFVDKGARLKPHPGASGKYSDKFPDVLLTDQSGKTHRFYSDLVKNRIVAIQFFYTTCSGI